MITEQIILACPTCGNDIENVGAECRCPLCGVVGQTIDEIPCFSDPNYYWGEVPHAEMKRINELARALGWHSAVETSITDAQMRNYICSPHRADFQYIWDLPQSATVLDIGAGWGAIASELGKNFSHIVAVEGVLERCRFIHMRTRQLKQTNVTVVCADFLKLPFATNQFDAVVLNGVLEWSAINSQGNCRDVQLNFLRRIRDLLKPSGSLCIGIENRIGLAMLRGAIDHSGMPYTSLMPRIMADALCFLRSKRFRSSVNINYRTYTYSLNGYRRLFRDAGLHLMQAFHASDGYNAPSLLIPIDRPESILHFIANRHSTRLAWLGRLRKMVLALAARSGVWAQLASEYIFLVKRADNV